MYYIFFLLISLQLIFSYFSFDVTGTNVGIAVGLPGKHQHTGNVRVRARAQAIGYNATIDCIGVVGVAIAVSSSVDRIAVRTHVIHTKQKIHTWFTKPAATS